MENTEENATLKTDKSETVQEQEHEFSYKEKEAAVYRSRMVHWYAEDCMEAMLTGISVVHPSLHVDQITKTVFLNRFRKNRVALLTGGCAGHEPFSFGYVGENMLTCSVMGGMYSSPSPQAILCAIKNIISLNKGGVLLIILNNTGNVLNFGLAIEVARSRGIEVESVAIGDDISIEGRELSVAGKRGSVGIVFAFKIAGALSTTCHTLSEIALTVHAVNSRLASIGVCLEACSLPNQPMMFNIPADAMHIGVGNQGEAGADIQQLLPTGEIVALLLNKLKNSLKLEEGDNVCVIVNDMGGLSSVEMFLICAEVQSQIVNLGFNIVRMYTGRLLTSLDTNGFHLCLFNVSGKEEWIPLLDVKTEASSWPGTRLSFLGDEPRISIIYDHDDKMEEPPANSMELNDRLGIVMKDCLEAVCKALINEEAKLNELDSGCGDGDTGSTFKGFAKSVLNQLNHLPVRKVGQLFIILSRIAETEMGGVTGGFYSLLLLGAARNSFDWVSLCTGAVDLMKAYTSAKLEYRTMLDALLPAHFIFTRVIKEKGIREWRLAMRLAVERAAVGCDSTRDMIARAGKASQVNPSLVKDVDPGAYAVVTWLSAIYKVLTTYGHLELETAHFSSK